MIPPCNALYTRIPLDRAYVASRLGLDPHVLSGRLHKMKKATGIKGASVWVCLDDGEVYDPANGESIGNLNYNGS
jgi:hypothetical protein